MCAWRYGASVVLYQYSSLILSKEWDYIRVYDLINIPSSSQVSLRNMKWGFGVEGKSTPYHEFTASAVSVPLDNTLWLVSFTKSTVNILVQSLGLDSK